MKMSDYYNSINDEAYADYSDRGSKFHAYLFPITVRADLEARIAQLKSAHLKARHHCYAYRLLGGVDFSSDDGEPSGSAGKPILNQLLSNDLVDVACVVVRYFGGTKLGVSGLINAYKSSAKYAIEEAKIIEKSITKELVCSFDYAIMGTVMDSVKQLGIYIKAKRLDQNPQIILEVPASEAESTKNRLLAKLLNRSVEDIESDTIYPGLKITFD